MGVIWSKTVVFYFRWKITFTSGHCPNHLNPTHPPPPGWGMWRLQKWKRNWKRVGCPSVGTVKSCSFPVTGVGKTTNSELFYDLKQNCCWFMKAGSRPGPIKCLERYKTLKTNLPKTYMKEGLLGVCVSTTRRPSRLRRSGREITTPAFAPSAFRPWNNISVYQLRLSC